MSGKTKDIFTVMLLPVLLIGCLILNIQLYWGLFLGYFITFVRAYSKKRKISRIMKVSIEGTYKVKNVLLMLTFIGALISVWMSMGTIPSLIYFGVEYLTKINMVVSAFLATLIMSMILGTGVGTVSTIGMVYLGIAKGLGIPLPIITGAIVSGAYFGDRNSLMSSNANLVASVTEIKIGDSVKYMLKTGIYAGIISIVLFWYFGKNYSGNFDIVGSIESLKILLANNFNVSIISLIPPIVLFAMVLVFKKTMIQSIIATLIVSFLIGALSIKGYFLEGFSYMLFGYVPNSLDAADIISGGGIVSMINVLTIIAVSTAICGIYDDTKMILPIVEPFERRINSLFSMYVFAGGLSLLISLTTCNQTLSSIIPGNYLKNRCDEVGVSRLDFARIISDTGMITVPIIPWNVNAILVTSITGVSAFDYLPFASFCYVLPVFSMIYYFAKDRRGSKLRYQFKNI